MNKQPELQGNTRKGGGPRNCNVAGAYTYYVGRYPYNPFNRDHAVPYKQVSLLQDAALPRPKRLRYQN